MWVVAKGLPVQFYLLCQVESLHSLYVRGVHSVTLQAAWLFVSNVLWTNYFDTVFMQYCIWWLLGVSVCVFMNVYLLACMCEVQFNYVHILPTLFYDKI